MSKRDKKILSVYRGYLSYNRGTPLRVKSLIKEMSCDTEIELHTASMDGESIFKESHLQLRGNIIQNVLELNKYIRRQKIDIIVFHTITSGYYLLLLMIINRKYARVLEMHGFLEEESRLCGDIEIWRYFRNKFIYSIIYRMSSVITTCSETAKEKLLKFNKKVYVVYGGVDFTKFNPTFIKKYNNNLGQTVIGYSGNGRKWQGLDFLLDTFSTLVKKDPSFSLRLLISEDVDIKKVSNVTVFKPVSHSEVVYFNASCDIMVIPRPDNIVNTLSFPSKLLEYLATGVAVVGSETSDIHKIITNRENGMLYKPGDTRGLINCLEELKDDELRKKISRNGYLTAKENYSWENQGKLFVSLIKNIQ